MLLTATFLLLAVTVYKCIGTRPINKYNYIVYTH